MHGIKEDFDQWRSTLTQEEKEMLKEQSQGEFNKAFRKSDRFKEDIPEDKRESFAKVLKKFFDNEAEDYVKAEKLRKRPEPGALLKKAGDKKLDFSLTNRIVEIDRMADRRYNYAVAKNREAKAQGKYFPQSSPLMEIWEYRNNDTDSHNYNLQVMETIKEIAANESNPKPFKDMLDKLIAKGIPAVGEKFELTIPEVMATQVRTVVKWVRQEGNLRMENHTEEEMKKWAEEELPGKIGNLFVWMWNNYVSTRDEVEGAALKVREFFRLQETRKDQTDLTKADILKEIWAELPKAFPDRTVPPLNEEVLAELAKTPAILEGEFMHSWGTADVLYKSEAIDAFGKKFLLGIFETKEEAHATFLKWNEEYEKAREKQADDMKQWCKQEQARLDKDESMPGVQRIRKVIADAAQGISGDGGLSG